MQPTYLEMTGDIAPRSFRGYDGVGRYENHTGRNEFQTLKVAVDREKVYFYVACTAPITAPSKENWMSLYLKCSEETKPNWEGYQFAINRIVPDGQSALVERANRDGEYSWETIGHAQIRVEGHEMMLAVERRLLGLCGDSVTLEFKWSDHMQAPDVMDFYQNGDAAPRGRMNYLFKTSDALQC